MDKIRVPLDGSSADTPAERLVEAVFGIEGGCEYHVPKRVRATHRTALLVKGAETLEFIGEAKPYISVVDLCFDCLLDARDDSDDQITFIAAARLRAPGP